MGDKLTSESIVRYYFGTINTWFTVVERAGFEQQFEQMWLEPSAEAGLLSLSMLLIVRAPEENAEASIQNSLYHSVKTLCTLVAVKVPLSTSVLQAHLLVCLYELCHFMPQQAYLTLGTCATIVRAFGWHIESFWSHDQWIVRPRELKMSSILWWSMMFLESGLQAEEIGYPRSLPILGFSIPFPESFDPFLRLPQGTQYGGTIQSGTFRFADGGDDKIDTIVWPEAKSTSFLTQVLQQPTGDFGTQGLSRDDMTAAMLEHARNIVSMPWKDGSRYAALSLTYTAILKLNYPNVGVGTDLQISYNLRDTNVLQNTLPVIESICHSARLITSPGNLTFLGPLVPSMAYSVFLAAMILIGLGSTVLQDPEWPHKVQLLRSCLELFAKRWKIAERHLQALNASFQARLSQLHSQ